ncbi:glycosyltransferase family 2 protein [Algoriphagus lacus]|uniref:Glycosyltransferase family 2 protein n=1 Tax=Algoriphagus lacus TaxID=2056311 RepID=A0A418PNW0_9BACT|nr:glycosyltransferase family 2 protein [Algoriphagus lacus]RIW13391.1 glycosyltransferase family 2 protein [Algoriphagus lacus]
MSTLKISVVLPNFNGKDLLESFLPYTFEALRNSQVDFEFILVDDASTDESVPWTKSSYPEIKIIQNSSNRGFSNSCNCGIEASQGDLVLLLNSDIRLSPDYFQNQLKYFDDEDTFGVMGKILNSHNRELEIGAKIPRRSGIFLKSDIQYIPKTAESWAPTLFLSGANALIDRKKLIALGGLDEVFSPFYAEDLDLSVRAWRMGWKCYFEKESVCYHLGSKTIKSNNPNPRIKATYFRNRMIFHAIHLEPNQLNSWKLQTLVLDVLPKLLLGKFWILTSYREMIKLWPQIKKSRQQLSEILQVQSNHPLTLEDVEQEILYMLPKSLELQSI